MTLLEQIRMLAGPIRANTMVKAAEFILQLPPEEDSMIETGCFRGMECDGNSTLIFAMLAEERLSEFISVDNSSEQIEKAKKHLSTHNLIDIIDIEFVQCDSVEFLSRYEDNINFLYLDSFDHSDADPLGGQLHQLAELGAAYGKLIAPCAVLLDDNIESDGGKTRLSADFLRRRGWTEVATGYQILFVKQ